MWGSKFPLVVYPFFMDCIKIGSFFSTLSSSSSEDEEDSLYSAPTAGLTGPIPFYCYDGIFDYCFIDWTWVTCFSTLWNYSTPNFYFFSCYEFKYYW